ncbi:Ppx/GppA phosphatase [Emticicia oligotrophica DSM 17448]|uniref:Ppx/GppA phosphatase n=1 Tax=Emticicia oligotrophica (strain DSM 17448 / CIP 109782 / MTCC 6937 / GPTSA100-15) TaxID=929562 RepID=A0ABN4AIC8_EMTOG|nr:rod shape-determining protein [Emticicia oligotrophica]AFK01771.1 Ppx/GppA phosphatase [Emticicia oligotrophica DSM 17448]
MRTAIIDLGTNTFHLLIVEGSKKIFQTSIPAKIGKGGISQGVISEEGIQRALTVLRGFKEEIDKHEIAIEKIYATGTSAIRNAGNKAEFIERVEQETGIKIRVISGEEEAELICLGVKQAMSIPETSMIMDIGGGSVEFIICNDEKIFWKQSFEIGGQRLMDKFMKSDPISMRSIQMMDDYFREALLPLANACHQYAPKVLIGSSGSFDTLIDMQYMKEKGQLPEAHEVAFEYQIPAFYWAYDELIFKNHEERMQIPGMIELRVDMIVVAMCLIRFIIQLHEIQRIRVSSYALKEGIMAQALKN